MKRTLINIIVLILIPALGMAQNKDLDKLKRYLKSAKTDSARYMIENSFAWDYADTNRDTSLLYFNRALVLAKNNNQALAEASSLQGKGYILYLQAKFPESLNYLEQALKIADDPHSESSNWTPDVRWLKSYYPNKRRVNIVAGINLSLGLLMNATGNNDKQMFYYRESRRLAKEAGDNELLGMNYMNMGYDYLAANMQDSVLIIARRAEQLFKQTGYRKYLSVVYDMEGYITLNKGNVGLSLQYFHQAINNGIEQNYAEVGGYYSLFRYYLSKKQKDSSIYYAKQSLVASRKSGEKDLSYGFMALNQAYKISNNIDSAYKYQGLALNAKDSTYQATAKSLTDFQKLSLKEQLQEHEQEKEKAASQARFRAYILIAGLIIFMLLAGVFYRNSRQRQQANKVLEGTLHTLKSTQAQLIQSEKMASLGELTAGIAHEIQNPLNFVNNFSEVSSELTQELKEELKNGHTEFAIAIADDLEKNLGKISHHGKRADAIVKGMLQHSQAGSGIKKPTNIHALADECMRLAYHGLRAKDKSFNANFATHFDETLQRVNAIPQDISRVLLNLFNNAFYAVNQKAKTAGGDYKPEVSVTTFTENDQAVIKVKDNGIGIPNNIKEKIMQPFFTTKPTGEGTGLGLSLSYDIVVKGHRGSIQVNSVDGEGTEFIVILPA